MISQILFWISTGAREPYPGMTDCQIQELQIQEGMPRRIQDPKEKE